MSLSGLILQISLSLLTLNRQTHLIPGHILLSSVPINLQLSLTLLLSGLRLQQLRIGLWREGRSSRIGRVLWLRRIGKERLYIVPGSGEFCQFASIVENVARGD